MRPTGARARRRIAGLLGACAVQAAALLAATAQAQTTPKPTPVAATAWVVQATGGRQCGTPGVSLAQHQAMLKAAGVAVVAARCATDGRMRAAVCGAGDGRLNAFEVPVATVSQAEKLGFTPLQGLRGAQFTDCP